LHEFSSYFIIFSWLKFHVLATAIVLDSIEKLFLREKPVPILITLQRYNYAQYAHRGKLRESIGVFTHFNFFVKIFTKING